MGQELESELQACSFCQRDTEEVTRLLEQHNAVYMLAIGGTGALLAKHITASEVIAFPELGPEAARIFTVKDFPLIVGIDTTGVSALFE